jgi:hypothetical protein
MLVTADNRTRNCHEQDCCLDVARQRPVSNLIWHVTMSSVLSPGGTTQWTGCLPSGAMAVTTPATLRCSAAPSLTRCYSAGAILGGGRWYDVAVRKFEGYDCWRCQVPPRPPGVREPPRSTAAAPSWRDWPVSAQAKSSLRSRLLVARAGRSAGKTQASGRR